MEKTIGHWKEEKATLSYKGIKLHLPLTYIHRMVGIFAYYLQNKPTLFQSDIEMDMEKLDWKMKEMLSNIEKDMWDNTN